MVLALLGLVLLATSGCVYLRLLRLQRQLADFDRYFAVETDDGLVLRCRAPVLRASDMEWLGFVAHTRTPLVAAPPAPAPASAPAGPHRSRPRAEAGAESETAAEGQAAGERWELRWVKQLPPGAPAEKDVFDLDATIEVSGDRVVAVALPERLFEVLSKDLFTQSLRAIGTAEVDREERTAEAEVGSGGATPPSLPTLADFDRLVGQPWAQRNEDARIVREYRYLQDTPGRRPPPPVVVILTFAPEGGPMTHMRVRLGRGSFDFDFAGSP